MHPRTTPLSCLRLLEGFPCKYGDIQSVSRILVKSSHSRFSTSSRSQASQRQQREYGDPYALAQARQRKAANLARQAVLKKKRAASIGDPIRGITTPFIESLDPIGTPLTTRPDSESNSSEDSTLHPESRSLNFYLSQAEFSTAVEAIRAFSEPMPSAQRYGADPQKEEEAMEKHQREHQNAEVALQRIVSLSTGGSKDRTHANIRRCVETFGRHRTDEILPPKPSVPLDPSLPPPEPKTPRVGPDTGSAEVQAAVLTAKIRVLANHLEGKGKQDKVNKRNLRLLVHRRQKMLQYLRRKERGGPRWTHLIETLGLTEGTWKGEISL